MTKLTMLMATVAVGALLAGCGSTAGDRTTSSRQSSTAASTAAAQPAPSAQVRQVQQTLNSQGFYSGEADGIWGPRTADALRNFQQARGIEQTAQMDSRTMTALGLNADGTPMSQTTTVPSATAPSTTGTTGTGMSSTSGTGMSGATGTGTGATGTTAGTLNQPATAPYPATGTTAGSGTASTRTAAPNAGTSSTRTPGNDRQNQQSSIVPPQQPAYGTAGSARSSADLNRRPDQQASASGVMTSRARVREVQESLERAGHDVGEVDGVWGPRTAKALRDFQQARGLDATGRLDDRSLDALGVRGRS